MASITFNDEYTNIYKVYFYDDSIDTYTFLANSGINIDYFSDDAEVGDCIVFAGYKSSTSRGKYNELKFNVSTQLAANSITTVWEYAKRPYTTPTWTALADVVDDTNSFQNAGVNVVGWTVPEDWENYVYPGGNTQYYAWYVRCRITALDTLTEGGHQDASTNIFTKPYCINVSGYTEGIPATFSDIYDADVAGGWGVVENDSNQYSFNCGLYLKSGCYFTTKQEQILFKKNWDCYFIGVIKSGEVVIGDKCKNGSAFTFMLYNGDLGGTLAYTNGEIYNTQYRYVHMTGSSVFHGHWGGNLGSVSGQIIYDVYGEGLRQFNFSYDGNAIIGIKGFGMHVENPGAILKNITCYGVNHSVRPSSGNSGDYMHDCDFSGCTLAPINPYHVTSSDGQTMDFVDCNWGTFSDTNKMRWTNNVGPAAYYPTYFETYSILIKVVDGDNEAINDSTAILVDKNNTEIFSYNTNVDGYPGQENGAISSATASTLTDSFKSWSSNQWWFQEVYITSGLGIGQRRIIKKGNTGTELQVAPDWDTTPNNTSKYIIIPYVRIKMFEPIDLITSNVWSTVTNYNPFTLTLSKAGFNTYVLKLTIDKKMDSIITLGQNAVIGDSYITYNTITSQVEFYNDGVLIRAYE